MAVDAGALEAGPRGRRARLRLSGLLWQRPWLKALALLIVPLAAFAVVYLGALAFMFVSSLFGVLPPASVRRKATPCCLVQQ